MHAVVWRHSLHDAVAAKTMASDNVFGVKASFRTFSERQNVSHTFEQQTHSQFYMRDARTLNVARRTTPKIVEKVSKYVKYYFVNYSCLHGMAAGHINLGRQRAPDHSNRKYR